MRRPAATPLRRARRNARGTKSRGHEHVVGGQVVDRRPPEPHERLVDAAAQDLQDVPDAGLPRAASPHRYARPTSTARAPSASALTTSPPRLIPPSKRISISSADCLDDRGQRADRGRRAVEVVAAVVGDRERVGADRPPRAWRRRGASRPSRGTGPPTARASTRCPTRRAAGSGSTRRRRRRTSERPRRAARGWAR